MGGKTFAQAVELAIKTYNLKIANNPFHVILNGHVGVRAIRRER
jgi:hypothetical protein